MAKLQVQREDGTPIEWEQAKEFSKYLISSDGQVYSLSTHKLIGIGITPQGYMRVDVYNDKCIKKSMKVHRLVYMAHKGPIPKGLQINHKDEDKLNNNIDNLNLMTVKQNANHGTRNERISKTLKATLAKKRKEAASL